MRWRSLIRPVMIAVPLAALLAAAHVCLVQTVASAGAGTATRAPAPAEPIRIMPLGDSITGSPGCWRALLWQKLQKAGYTGIDFVGTQPAQGCGIPYDGDHEGHGGALVTTVADQNQLPAWLAASRPDIVIMHFGTNDVWSNRTNDQILTAYGTLVDQMRASNPNMRILVAKIIPVAPGSCPECPQRTVRLNDAIPTWAAAMTTARSPITVVDQWSGWNPATDTSDGVHPTDPVGITRMADTWYPAVVATLTGTQPGPTNPTGAPPTASGSHRSPRQ